MIALTLKKVGMIGGALLRSAQKEYESGNLSPSASHELLRDLSQLSLFAAELSSTPEELPSSLNPVFLKSLACWLQPRENSALHTVEGPDGTKSWVKTLPADFGSEAEQGSFALQLLEEAPDLKGVVFPEELSPLPGYNIIFNLLKPSVRKWRVQGDGTLRCVYPSGNGTGQQNVLSLADWMWGASSHSAVALVFRNGVPKF